MTAPGSTTSGFSSPKSEPVNLQQRTSTMTSHRPVEAMSGAVVLYSTQNLLTSNANAQTAPFATLSNSFSTPVLRKSTFTSEVSQNLDMSEFSLSLQTIQQPAHQVEAWGRLQIVFTKSNYQYQVSHYNIQVLLVRKRACPVFITQSHLT
jgi:hypothetical protein